MDYDYQRLQMRSEDVVGFHSNLMVERQHKRYWFVKDVCGIICAMMTWGLILYAEFVVMTVILLPNPYPVYSYVNMVIFNLLAFLATASHMRTMFSDPVSGMRAGLSRDSGVTLSSSLSPFAGICAQGQCHPGDDPVAEPARRTDLLQMRQVLFDQTAEGSSLLRLPAMHPEDGSPLSMGKRERRTWVSKNL